VHSLRLEWPRSWSQAALQAEIDEALQEDPGHVAALARKAARDPVNALKWAHLAVATHPENPDAWTLLASSLPKGATQEREAPLRRAVEHAPDHPYYLALLAAALADAGQTEEAWSVSQRAVDLAPWSPLALFIQALMLEHRGDCGTALSTIKRAADVFRENMPREAVIGMENERKRMEKECVPRSGRQQ
jgi:tetratricopeptide (TPR) repeat protein